MAFLRQTALAWNFYGYVLAFTTRKVLQDPATECFRFVSSSSKVLPFLCFERLAKSSLTAPRMEDSHQNLKASILTIEPFGQDNKLYTCHRLYCKNPYFSQWTWWPSSLMCLISRVYTNQGPKLGGAPGTDIFSPTLRFGRLSARLALKILGHVYVCKYLGTRISGLVPRIFTLEKSLKFEPWKQCSN